MENDPTSVETHKAEFLQTIDSLLEKYTWVESGKLFFGTGSVGSSRGPGITGGPGFVELRDSQYTLRKLRDERHTIIVHAEDEEVVGDKLSVMRTDFIVNRTTGELTVYQVRSDHVKPVNAEQKVGTGYPLLGIDCATLSAQWESLASLSGEWDRP